MTRDKADADAELLAKWRELAKAGSAREIRIKAGLSARALARELGVSWSAVHFYEGHASQRRNPSGANGLRWAKVMERLAAEVAS